jgi:hypothetical protein
LDIFLPSALFYWCQSTPLAAWINSSPGAVSAIEMMHVIALAVLVAAAAAIDLRVLGLMTRGRAVAAVAASARPYIRGSLAVVVLTGGLVFMSQPIKYGHSVAFLVTALLFGAAVATHLTIVRRAAGSAELASVRFRKLAAYLSLALWLAAAAAERGLAGIP